MDEGAGMEARLGELARHPSRGAGQIDKAVMVDLAARGLNQTQIADFFAVSGAAVSRMRKRLAVAVDRDVATSEAANKLLDAHLLGGARLAELAEECKSLIGLCNVVVHAQDEFAPEVREAKTKLLRLVDGKRGSVGQMAVALMGEARKQLEFAFKIQSESYNLRRVEEFQAVVLVEIKAAAPDVQQRIMARLAQVQAFRAATEISGPGPSLTF